MFLVEKPEGKRSLSTRYEYERYEGRNAEVLPHILGTPVVCNTKIIFVKCGIRNCSLLDLTDPRQWPRVSALKTVTNLWAYEEWNSLKNGETTRFSRNQSYTLILQLNT